MAYIYRHIDSFTDNVIYIGKGVDTYFDRAYDLKNRNRFWKDLYKHDRIEVEILFESDDHEFIKQKEIEFIALYGRKDLGKGTLVNLTDGGDGCKNMSKESTNGISKSNIERGSKTRESIKNLIKEWDFNLNGKITQDKISKILGMNVRTIKRHWREIKEEINKFEY